VNLKTICLRIGSKLRLFAMGLMRIAKILNQAFSPDRIERWFLVPIGPKPCPKCGNS
jgi:hypothetical protein